MLTLNDILSKSGIDLTTCLVLRHCPQEVAFRRRFAWLADERPDLFNWYNQTQDGLCGKQMKKASTVVALIGQSPGHATFVGVYSFRNHELLTVGEWQSLPLSKELICLGHRFVTDQLELAKPRLLVDLQHDPIFSCYAGRLVLHWPPPEISWSRWAIKNEMRIAALHPESVFAERMPDWRELVVSWADLKILPSSWKQQLAQWRGIYYIFDVGLQQGYVGSAYGNENLLQRWQYYAKTGHGDNKRLLKCDPEKFRFSILEWVDPTASPAEVIERESTWKKRLHTKEQGLNAN